MLQEINALIAVDPAAVTSAMHRRVHLATFTGEVYHEVRPFVCTTLQQSPSLGSFTVTTRLVADMIQTANRCRTLAPLARLGREGGRGFLPSRAFIEKAAEIFPNDLSAIFTMPGAPFPCL